IHTSDNRRLFNITKLAAEEICLKSNKNITIIRPSNVYGTAINSSLFLPSIVRDAIQKKEINMFVSPEYSKDYISVND
ncbi:NAD-dependent epimerase/dehydratase family protein, partial [Proteus faecis]